MKPRKFIGFVVAVVVLVSLVYAWRSGEAYFQQMLLVLVPAVVGLSALLLQDQGKPDKDDSQKS